MCCLSEVQKCLKTVVYIIQSNQVRAQKFYHNNNKKKKVTIPSHSYTAVFLFLIVLDLSFFCLLFFVFISTFDFILWRAQGG